MSKSKRISIKNPFIFNITWLSILALISFWLWFSPCLNFSENWKHVIIGLFYSALILLINEVVQFFRDEKEFGILEGKYIREDMLEKLENGLRCENLSEEQKTKIRQDEKEILFGTSYTRITYGIGKTWSIELKYLYKGVYYGKVKYPRYWDNKKQSTDVLITLNLNNDLATGTGTYSYTERNDYGTYTFQISEIDRNEIIIRYKNILPSGIAEGYEIWKKINPRV